MEFFQGCRYFQFSLNPVKYLINDLRSLKKDSERGDSDPPFEPHSKDNKKLIEKMKLESTPDKEVDKAMVSRSKPYFIEKASNPYEMNKKHNDRKIHIRLSKKLFGKTKMIMDLNFFMKQKT